MPRETIAERFWDKVDKGNPGECWEWRGYRNAKGYGGIRIRGKGVYAHRLSYELNNGPIPDGMLVCHTCDNPPCVNPGHLWTGSHKDNAADKMRKGRYRHVPRARELNGNAKLTAQIAAAIRAEPAGNTVRGLAAKYGVSKSTISAVRRGAAW